MKSNGILRCAYPVTRVHRITLNGRTEEVVVHETMRRERMMRTDYDQNAARLRQEAARRMETALSVGGMYGASVRRDAEEKSAHADALDAERDSLKWRGDGTRCE